MRMATVTLTTGDDRASPTELSRMRSADAPTARGTRRRILAAAIAAWVLGTCALPGIPAGTHARAASPAPTPPLGSDESPTPALTPTPMPSRTPRPEPLPRCTYEDVVTRDRDQGDWASTFLDTVYRLPAGYAPSDLVATRVAGGGAVRRLVVADLRAMVRDAAASGAPVQVVSAYRSYGTQVYDFAYWTRLSGLPAALLGSARPGHSEHQLGTTLDFTSLGGGLPWRLFDWGATAAGTWMRRNAWRYGFVMSYPMNGSPSKTCYRYEPWHFRYVGRDRAATIRRSGLTLREYLWRERPR